MLPRYTMGKHPGMKITGSWERCDRYLYLRNDQRVEAVTDQTLIKPPFNRVAQRKNAYLTLFKLVPFAS